MKKQLISIAISTILTFGTVIQCYAGQWQQDEAGWKYQEDDGNYVVSQWKWIDGDGDGICESYCFDETGHIYTDTVTPDGYQVNNDGAWVENGEVNTKSVSKEITATYSNDSVLDTFVGKWEEKSYGNTTYGSYGAPHFYIMLEISKKDNGTLNVLGWARVELTDDWERYPYFDKTLSPVGDGIYMGPDQSGYNLTEDMYFSVEGDNMASWYTNKYTTVYQLYEKID